MPHLSGVGRVAAVVVCALSWLGCSLIYSANSLTDGPRSDGGDGVQPEGSAGPSKCSSSFVFCDGFEDGLSRWTQVTTGGGTVVVDAMHVYRGSYALHSELPAITMAGLAAMTAQVRPQVAIPEPAYVRFFVYLSSPAPTSGTALWNMNDPATSGTQIGLSGGSGLVSLATFGQVGNQTATANPLPLDQWTCLEMGVDGSTVNVSMNGATILSLPFTSALGDFTVLGLGYGAPQAGDPVHDVWFDEVAIDSATIGCDQ